MKSLRFAVLTALGAVCLAGTSAHGQTLNTLYFFSGPDGENSYAPLIEGVDSNFYGTTSGGGANSAGTVFRITSTGALTTLWSFCNLTNCIDGEDPQAALVQGIDSNFYGTTAFGGNQYDGTAFRFTSAGALTTLWSFCSSAGCTDGAVPQTSLVQGLDGNFYGTTANEGANSVGTVFRITSTGALTTLWSFCSLPDCSDGAYPEAALVQGIDSNFYGTTSGGGTNNAGTVFKITPAGALTPLWQFCSLPDCTDGAYPYAALFQAADGNFYGTTEYGGTNDDGTIFEITPAGVLTTLYQFSGPDGENPGASVVQGTDGNFYGTTPFGGNGFFTDSHENDLASQAKVQPAEAIFTGDGTVFKLIVVPQPCGISGTLGICPGQPTTLTADPGMLSYLWSGPQDSGATNQSITVDTTGTYYVTQVDSNSLTNTCSATVTNLSGGTPCIWKCPTNITWAIPPGSCCATVTWGAPCASNSCGPVNCWCSPASGSCFAKGMTPVIVTADDGLGH